MKTLIIIIKRYLITKSIIKRNLEKKYLVHWSVSWSKWGDSKRFQTKKEALLYAKTKTCSTISKTSLKSIWLEKENTGWQWKWNYNNKELVF